MVMIKSINKITNKVTRKFHSLLFRVLNKLLILFILVAFSQGFSLIFPWKEKDKQVSQFLKEKLNEKVFTFSSQRQNPIHENLFSNISQTRNLTNFPQDTCTGSSDDLVESGSCTCSSNHHPKSCTCSYQSDSNCLCSTKLQYNPSDCICSGASGQYTSTCKCSGGAGDSNTCTSPGDSGIPLTTPQASPDCIVPSSGTVPDYSCACTSSNHPTGCACPQNPTSLNDITKEQCKCLKTGDLRVGCESKPDCAHPTISTSTIICPCLANNDPREECNIDYSSVSKEAAGTLRISMSFITAAVILPLLMQW
ncbi:MAG: hypothetical protein EZS28_011458 [Streblomastix strix]|uniref:Uncharacterized protein n=1 Tax=Streblomastix strix TaxID=222440 RepID=A0A5J4WF42_9EUKA|nr:MAG: hypothetical protein EZS28_011458 [Streblomastix strix]